MTGSDEARCTRERPGMSAFAFERNAVYHTYSGLLEVQGGTYVPSMHRKHSSNGGRGRIHGRNSGGVHRQVQGIFQSEWSQSVSGKKGEMIWQ